MLGGEATQTWPRVVAATGVNGSVLGDGNCCYLTFSYLLKPELRELREEDVNKPLQVLAKSARAACAAYTQLYGIGDKEYLTDTEILVKFPNGNHQFATRVVDANFDEKSVAVLAKKMATPTVWAGTETLCVMAKVSGRRYVFIV